MICFSSLKQLASPASINKSTNNKVKRQAGMGGGLDIFFSSFGFQCCIEPMAAQCSSFVLERAAAASDIAIIAIAASKKCTFFQSK